MVETAAIEGARRNTRSAARSREQFPVNRWRGARPWLTCVMLFTPAVLSGQSLDGTVELGYGRASYDAGADRTVTGSFTQGYTLAYRSALWDPRFLTYAGELMFNRNALTLGEQDSRSRQTGFRATANLFAQRPFRATIRASRGFGGESANHPASTTARGGLGLPAGATAELQTSRSDFGVNWQLTAKSLPRIDVSYERDAARIAAGSLAAVQQQRSLQALIAREGTRVSNTLRYQRHAFDSDVSQAFRQRHSDLGYELLAKASSRTWGTVRAGRRTTESVFDMPLQFTDAGVGSYRPPPGGGEVALYYGQASLTHQAAKGISAEMNVGIDRERASAGTADAALANATTRYTTPGGVTVHGTATYGQRGQEISGTKLLVLTRGVSGGAEYRLLSRLLRAGASGEAGRGWNRSDRGLEGQSNHWRGRVDAGTDILRVLQLSASHDRARSTDDLLAFGNQQLERTQFTARSMISTRITLSATSEVATIDRGIASLLRTRYTQELATASFEPLRERRISVTAGRFTSRSLRDLDRNEYVGVDFSGRVIGPLQLTATLRRERMQSSAALLDQDGYYSTSALEYRLRLFTFSLEHRYTTLALNTAARAEPLMFRGNQMQFRVIRKFGVTP